jgi:hypothetical protein
MKNISENKVNELVNKNNSFSGLSEFPILGISGAKGLDFNRTYIQADEFKIPKEVQEKLKLKTFE